MSDGVWIAATRALGRPVLVDEPYPHICEIEVVGQVGRRFKTWRRDCAACAEINAPRGQE